MANVGIIMIASKRIEEKKEAKSYILLITLYKETVSKIRIAQQSYTLYVSWSPVG